MTTTETISDIAPPRSNFGPSINPTINGFVVTWLLFLVYSFCHAPIPSVNEPHYLTKAKHYWNSDWCSNDFFLESSNAHLVFYQTVGWLTQFLSLAQTAFVARLIGYGLLAFGWNSLATRIAQDKQAGSISAVLFLLLASIGNLSGEWVVGGIESKVFAYAFVLIGFSEALAGRRVSSGVSFGLAVAMHPLVGLWNAVAVGLAITLRLLRSDRWVTLRWLGTEVKRRSVQLGLIGFVLVSSWGILPALSVVAGSTPQETYYANFVQVFHRLSHHLDPMMISVERYVAYFVLTVVTWIGLRALRWQPAARWFASVVFASSIIAIVGCLIGMRSPSLSITDFATIPYFELRMTLLKFYPFRLFDSFLPILASIVGSHLISRNLVLLDVSRRAKQVLIAAVFVAALGMSANIGSNKHLDDEYVADWIDVCQWVDAHLLDDAVVMTPKDAWAFKWFAQRAEFVCGKDFPQDARGVAEWNQRLLFLRRWGERHFNSKSGYMRDVCLELANNKFQAITHILERRLGPLDLPVRYRNATFTVYEVR